jgi:hypothetical protein
MDFNLFGGIMPSMPGLVKLEVAPKICAAKRRWA